MTFIQRRIKGDATYWCCIDVDAALSQRCAFSFRLHFSVREVAPIGEVVANIHCRDGNNMIEDNKYFYFKVAALVSKGNKDRRGAKQNIRHSCINNRIRKFVINMTANNHFLTFFLLMTVDCK